MDTVNTSDVTYLVDLENTGTQSLLNHITEHPEAKYIIFYSDSTSSPGSILEHIPIGVQAEFKDCKSGGNNAMDFCICATAGRMSAGIKKAVRILSNDKGYDPMVHMLQEQGMRIKREIPTYIQQEQKKNKDKKQDMKEKTWQDSLIQAIKANVPKHYQQNLLQTLPGVLSRKEAYEMIQAIMPQEKAAEIYRKLRKYIPKEVE